MKFSNRYLSYAFAGAAFAATGTPFASSLSLRSHEATHDGRMPIVYLASNLPHLGCDQSPLAHAANAASYKHWIREFADGLGDKKPVVVLEPRAIAEIDCLEGREKAERYELIVDAVRVLKATGSRVYIDAGYARGISSEEMARRLKLAGIGMADGFSLNISGFLGNGVTIAYGTDLSRRIGGKHFVIDTSRNGRNASPSGDRCSSPGQLAGLEPTTNTGNSLVDALLWVRTAREANGTCVGLSNGKWL